MVASVFSHNAATRHGFPTKSRERYMFSGVCAFENLGILNCDKGVDLVANTGKVQVLCLLIFYRTGYYRVMHSRDTLIDYFYTIHTVCILNSWVLSTSLTVGSYPHGARRLRRILAFATQLETLKCEVCENGRGCDWKRDYSTRSSGVYILREIEGKRGGERKKEVERKRENENEKERE